jgi:hypothetical protein
MDETTALPLILAGPILRRVTSQSVTVWLASSSPITPTLRIYDKNDEEIGNSEPRDLVAANTHASSEPLPPPVMLGQNLYVTLLEAKPINTDEAATFPLDELLTYNLFDGDGQALPEMADVCLAGEERPGFYITNQLQMFAYGSCRKPHGLSFDDQENGQQKDSLALLAEHLGSNVRQLDNRPSHLFLVGDQIYADEVPIPVMQFLQKLAVRLVGKDIALPGGITLGTICPEQRAIVKKECGLTSECPDMHLMSFGEFAAMYLLVFGNRIQFSIPADAPDDEAMQGLRHFLASQAQVRKTFANIPTYMMFDDHDVTDDWNLNRSWYNQVHSSCAGSRVVSNALAAFWAFQGWGNEPTKFPQTFIDTLQNHLCRPEKSEWAEHYDFTLRNFHHWGFVLPTTPPIFLLDCRTQRDFGTFNSPPKLLDHYAIDALLEQWFGLDADNKKTTTVPIFITGTPVFGFSVIEWAQQLLYRLGFLFGVSIGKLSANSLDIESWLANRQGFSALLNAIRHRMDYRKATFIAGDVHYSFVNQAKYTSQISPQNIEELDCLQLTSSALRNTPSTGRSLQTFLANAVTKVRRGHSKPETLPWWYRIFFWRLLQNDVWKIEVTGIPGKSAKPCPAPNFKTWWEPMLADFTKRLWHTPTDPYTYWITCRPNVGLVYLQNGEVTKQVLLSGDDRDNTLTYEITPTQAS